MGSISPAVATDYQTLLSLGQLRDELAAGLDDLASAEDPANATMARRDLRRIAEQAGALAATASETPEGRMAKRSATQTRHATEDLAGIAREMSRLYEQAAVERTPSSEAQDEVVELSANVDALVDDLKGPSRSLGRASKAARVALERITPQLRANETERVASLKVAFSSSTFQKRLDDLNAKLDRRSSQLTSELGSLEPPDVVAECTSEYETVSDMSVRNMECTEADAAIIQAIPVLAPSFSVAGYSCSILGDFGPPEGPILGASDIRCESGDQAFRFAFAD